MNRKQLFLKIRRMSIGINLYRRNRISHNSFCEFYYSEYLMDLAKEEISKTIVPEQ